MEETYPGGFMEIASKFYYDTAQVPNEAAMRALKAVAPMDNIVFGTDFPFLSCLYHTDGLRDCGVFSEQELRGIDIDNILRWMPQHAK